MVGQYGEASEDVHWIADAVADALAGQRWRLMGARTRAEARAYFIGIVRRELGLPFVIAMARHRLQREPFVGMSRAALRAMRDARGLAAIRLRLRVLLPVGFRYGVSDLSPSSNIGSCSRTV